MGIGDFDSIASVFFILLYTPLSSFHSKKLYKIDGNISNIMGYPDDLKLKSSMTLFSIADPSNDIYKKILDKFYNGEVDQVTIDLLKK